MDSAVLLLPFILSTLVSTTLSLSCTECSGEKPCQGPSVTCPTDFDACVATLESTTKDGKEVQLYSQHCGKKDICSYSGSLTTDHGVKNVSSTCCFTNNCSPSKPTFPARKTDKNGVSCKACSAEKEKTCEPSTTIECIGDENSCVTMTIETKEPTSYSSFRGCGTQGWCKVKEREFMSEGKTTEIEIVCNGGNAALPLSLPLTLLAALSIIRVVY
ncbi:phospholipase A2 inhibitor NAI-like [Dendropsophus ebraccatus]|uniref:phospholipase A2 inhibitor NAI-like n=1 Tax=Dendropsophus ebraccatus TaxID=150705 RepID=UPI00383107C3